MDASVSQHRHQIAQLCERYHVQRLELFGSAAGDAFHPEHSDVDLLVEFGALAEGKHADAYFGLRESLGALFARHVDLVMTPAIRNPYFLHGIAPTQTLLYPA